MQRAAAAFVGKRDFTACMAAGSKILDATRHVMAASVEREGDYITFRVRADGFLYNMVRIMVGTLAEVAEGHMTPEAFGMIESDASDHNLLWCRFKLN